MYIYIDHSISFRIRVEEKRIRWIYVDFCWATMVWAIFEVTLGITAVLSAPSNTWARMGASAENPNASLNKGWTRNRVYQFISQYIPIKSLNCCLYHQIISNPHIPTGIPFLFAFSTILCTQLHGRSLWWTPWQWWSVFVGIPLHGLWWGDPQSISIGFLIINHPFLGSSILETPMWWW